MQYADEGQSSQHDSGSKISTACIAIAFDKRLHVELLSWSVVKLFLGTVIDCVDLYSQLLSWLLDSV